MNPVVVAQEFVMATVGGKTIRLESIIGPHEFVDRLVRGEGDPDRWHRSARWGAVQERHIEAVHLEWQDMILSDALLADPLA